jgi:pimeloyl-ACP methyl ester carboxylesterase
MKKLMPKLLGLYLNILAFISPARAARKSFLLFCRPLRPPINAKQQAFLDSARKFTLDHEGYSIQCYRWGSGAKQILLLHGWQSHTYRWKAYVDAFSKDEYTIFSIDAPGHGMSSGSFLTVPLYSSLIRMFIGKQGPMHAAFGHSLGGFALLHALYEARDLQIGRIVLLAPPGEASDFISVFKNTLGLSDMTVKLVIAYFAQQYDVTPDFFSARKFARDLRVKGLIIHDENDSEAPYRYAVSLQRVWQNSTLITTSALGHNLKSPAVIKAAVDFAHESILSQRIQSKG